MLMSSMAASLAKPSPTIPRSTTLYEEVWGGRFTVRSTQSDVGEGPLKLVNVLVGVESPLACKNMHIDANIMELLGISKEPKHML